MPPATPSATQPATTGKRELGARERMLVSTALLIRERGARATSLDDVLTHSGAPRGSIYHHFPGGREQLLREATGYAGEYLARRLERATADDPLQAIDALFDEYSGHLQRTDFRAGCPVVAVAIESPEEGPDLRNEACAAFERWRIVIARRLEEAGIEAVRAGELAMLILATFEGALILSRAYRDLGPLDGARREIRAKVNAELTHDND